MTHIDLILNLDMKILEDGIDKALLRLGIESGITSFCAYLQTSLSYDELHIESSFSVCELNIVDIVQAWCCT